MILLQNNAKFVELVWRSLDRMDEEYKIRLGRDFNEALSDRRSKMGAYKQAMIEEEDRHHRMMQTDNWPKCDRCTEPVDYDLVDLDENGEPSEYQDSSLCSYCEHMTSKDD